MGNACYCEGHFCYFARRNHYQYRCMKKIIVVFLLIVLTGLAGIYIFIPGKLLITEVAATPCVAEAGTRILADASRWPKWWPGKIVPGKNGESDYLLNEANYTVSQQMLNNLGLQIRFRNDSLGSHLSLLSLPHDSSLIKWECVLEAGNDPLARIRAYRKAVALKENMHQVMNAARQYLSNFQNIYGFILNEASTSDTTLITTKSFFPDYPSMPFVYAMAKKLQDYAQAANCAVTGVPMLNVTKLDSAGYQVMVAVPLAHSIQGNEQVKLQKMVPGRFIITDVQGGPGTLNNTHLQILNYFRDYRRTSMAIPFEYLITDRLKEPDTSKWITKIYSPVY